MAGATRAVAHIARLADAQEDLPGQLAAAQLILVRARSLPPHLDRLQATVMLTREGLTLSRKLQRGAASAQQVADAYRAGLPVEGLTVCRGRWSLPPRWWTVTVEAGVKASGMTRRSASRRSWQMRRRSEAMVSPIASCGNDAIGVERKSGTPDWAVAVH